MAPWTIYSHSKDRLYSSKKTIHIAGPENDVETTAKFQHLAPSRSAFWFTHRPPSMTGRFWSFLSSSSINDHLVLTRQFSPYGRFTLSHGRPLCTLLVQKALSRSSYFDQKFKIVPGKLLV